LSITEASWPHLKPLSDYSRRVACDQKSSPYQPGKFSNPFINLKFEVVDNCTSKRKMDDSSVDDGYETPAKKAFTTTTSSPDLGCFMDYCSPLTRQESVSPFSTSSPALLPKKQGIKNAMKENVSPQLHPEHVERGSSTDPRGKGETVPSSVQNQSNIVFFRVVVLNRQVDWEYKKNQYVHSVTQHLTENPGANHGVMSELLSLMSHVADQTTGSNGTQWQHPSDLTRRYAPSMMLHDWKAKNSPTQKRFAKVPKIFARTPFP
uniref:S100P-binding protein n=1 Tax=Stegastes partitus TaxID=144197 RepID=A0A3B4ZRB2_9TELE